MLNMTFQRSKSFLFHACSASDLCISQCHHILGVSLEIFAAQYVLFVCHTLRFLWIIKFDFDKYSFCFLTDHLFRSTIFKVKKYCLRWFVFKFLLHPSTRNSTPLSTFSLPTRQHNPYKVLIVAFLRAFEWTRVDNSSVFTYFYYHMLIIPFFLFHLN